jgi:hypothetical protein
MEFTLPKQAKDLTNRCFGRLTALSAVGRGTHSPSGSSRIVWRCQCTCGSIIDVKSPELLSGDTQSCGCLSREVLIARSTTHGMSRTRTYRIWANMLARCKYPSTPRFAYYGGRGISVCDRWNTFADFVADMGACPADHSIDRIDPNGNYEPSNCRWATRPTQMRNTRRSRMLTVGGETLHVNEWCLRTGMPKSTLWYRLDQGWSDERAVTTPVKR